MLPEEVLTSRMVELKKEFGGLFDDDTLKRIAMDEMGISMPNVKTVKELKDREEVTIELEVTKIGDMKEFEKRTGGRGKVRNLNVRDETGTCRIALWDADVELVETLEIEVGTKLRCIDCFVKQTDFGVDITKGKKGQIEKL
jgi:ssDNA-binding replication factor A large subunit